MLKLIIKYTMHLINAVLSKTRLFMPIRQVFHYKKKLCSLNVKKYPAIVKVNAI